MVKLASRTKCPPNGFLYKDPHTGWKSHVAVPGSQWSFEACAKSVLEYRLANPDVVGKYNLSTDLRIIREEVDFDNAARISKIRGAEGYLTGQSEIGDSIFPKTSLPRQMQKPANVVGSIKKIIAGVKLLKEWKAEGYDTVSLEEASVRAQICSGCPKNGQGDFTRWFTVPASEELSSQIEAFKELKLTTPRDSELNICEACLCPLKLKVHTPKLLILKHLLPESKSELDPRCWITK